MHRSTFSPLQDANPTPSFGGFGFSWNQILVLGDYGAGKTSLAIKMALYWSPVSEHEPATCAALYCQLSDATGVVHD